MSVKKVIDIFFKNRLKVMDGFSPLTIDECDLYYFFDGHISRIYDSNGILLDYYSENEIHLCVGGLKTTATIGTLKYYTSKLGEVL